MAEVSTLVHTRVVKDPYVSSKVRAPARRTRPPFSQVEIEESLPTLVNLVAAIAGAPTDDHGAVAEPDMQKLLQTHTRVSGGFFGKSHILAGFRAFSREDRIISEVELIERLRFRPTRTQSGVTPLTVLTKPFPCPGKCIFCPNDVRMPKSYLSDEPAAQRAEDNDFDPYIQTWVRLFAFHAMGHSLSKIELIVLGGTWSYYPEPYQRWFVKRCFDALNEFDGSETPKTNERPFAALSRHFEGRTLGVAGAETYNKIVSRRLKLLQNGSVAASHEDASWEELEEAQRLNEHAKQRAVGIVMETRPDHVSEEEVLRLRRLGATKVQIGFQSLNDEVLDLNKRGHSVDSAAQTVGLLRQAGFKIHAHWMLNLKGSTPEADKADFLKVTTDPRFMPDELKVYPCSLVESAELMVSYEDGSWAPYSRDELLDVLGHVVRATPRYCRITRMIRDIPATDIVIGSRRGNLRQDVEAANAGHSVEIRSREVRDRALRLDELSLRSSVYETSTSEERFLEWVTPEDKIAGFLRLSLPKDESFVTELGGSAVIREVHIYGRAVSVGKRKGGAPQHMGLGRRLIEDACTQARAAGFASMAVISSVGTRAYYRKLGFGDGVLYQHRTLTEAPITDA